MKITPRDPDFLRIVWHCQLNSKTGFSEVSECILPELHDLGADVYAATSGPWPAPEDELLRFLIQKHKYGKALGNAAHVACWSHEIMPSMPGMRRYGMGFSESTRARGSLVSSYNHMNGLFTTSSFSKRVLEESGCRARIVLVPPGSRDVFRQWAARPEGDEFSFLTVGVCQDRKNTRLVAKVFAETFPKNQFPSVKLVMKSSHCGSLDWVNSEGLADKANFELIWTGPDAGVPDLSSAQMRELFCRCDCMIHASKGEGGPLLDGLATGLPMIFTNWGVLSEYIKSDFSYPCRVASMEKAFSWGYPFSCEDSGEWANIDAREMARLMRHVVLNRDELAEKGKKAAEFVKKMAWRETAKAILAELEPSS